MSTARDRLLARLLSTFGEELPPPSASLREIAARVETSHALLRYHFGSHAGVLTAMLVAQRAQDNDTLTRGSSSANFSDLVERIWELYTHPKRIARARSFFLVAGLAAQDPETFTEFTASLNDLTVLLTDVARRDGDSDESAALRATVTVAALRGLLLQEVLAPGTPAEPALGLILQLAPSPAKTSRTGDGGDCVRR
jgi:AcrR family transcriptional regulator